MSHEVGFSWKAGGRIPTLDGIRAVSIGLVLLAHSFGTGIIPMNTRISILAGDIGVRSFFVLSGFLITTLLVRESEGHGKISLGRFYLRRAFRIFPAFYCYLLVLGVLALLGALSLRHGDMLAAATYTTNFHAHRTWTMGHLWSLAVEEQFYLVWPVVLAALGFFRGWWFAFASVLLAPIVRLALWRYMPEHRDLADQAFPCVFDALASGCLLALAMPRLSQSSTCARWLGSRWFWIVPLIGVAALTTRNPWLRYGVGMTIANTAIALIVLRCVARPTGRISTLLERPTLIWIGAMSYSLYLWQQLFVNRHSHLLINAFPFNVILAFGAAAACHYLIERRFLRLNDRWRVAPQPRRAPEISVLIPIQVIDVSNRQRPRTTADLPLLPSGIVHLEDPQ